VPRVFGREAKQWEQNLETQTIEQLIRTGLPGAQVQVTGDGSHFEAVVVSDAFAGLTPIKKQRLVMDTVRPQLASGELHALSLKTLTPEEWAARVG
jgi:acid stress-induced BolA-like protein IbaG/YrbA